MHRSIFNEARLIWLGTPEMGDALEMGMDALNAGKEAFESQFETLSESPDVTPDQVNEAATGMMNTAQEGLTKVTKAAQKRGDVFNEFKQKVEATLQNPQESVQQQTSGILESTTSQLGLSNNPNTNGINGPVELGKKPQEALSNNEATPLSPNEQLKEEIGQIFQSNNPAKQAEYDRMFDSMDPQKASAMQRAIQSYPPNQRAELMQSLAVNKQIMDQMSPDGLQKACSMPGATPAERQRIYQSMSPTDKRLVRSFPTQDGVRVGDLYSRTETQMNVQERGNPIGTMQQVASAGINAVNTLASAARNAPATIGSISEKAEEVTQAAIEKGEDLVSNENVENIVKTGQKITEKGKELFTKAREKNEQKKEGDEQESENNGDQQPEDAKEALGKRIDNAARRKIRAELMKNPKYKEQLQAADWAKRVETTGDQAARDKLIKWAEANGELTTTDKVKLAAFRKGQENGYVKDLVVDPLAGGDSDTIVRDEISQEYNDRMDLMAADTGMSRETLEWVALDPDSAYYESPDYQDVAGDMPSNILNLLGKLTG